MQVYAFAKIEDDTARYKVYNEIKSGKSRFGMWDQEKSLKEDYYGPNAFLLRIEKDDWIVHVNMPEYGQCVAVKTVGTYCFDDGISCPWGIDFNNYIPIDPNTIIEFDRHDPNIIPSVNLAPMRRGQRILQVDDFIASIENVKNSKYSGNNEEYRGIIHLRAKIDELLLPKITELIQKLNKSKDFEKLLHKIFEKMPNTLSIQNGFGWRSDNGADLIVEFQNPIIGVNLRSKLIIQAKSYEGDHYDLSGIDQLIEGINTYSADGGLLITTGKKTEELEKYTLEQSEKIGKVIDIIAGNDVARFVVRYAPEMLIGNI